MCYVQVSGSTLCNAVLSDVFTDEKERAGASAMLGSWSGVGVILGPLLGGKIMANSSPATCFGAAAALAVAQFGLVASCMPETLAAGARVKMNWNCISPLSFFKLFKGTATLRQLAIVMGLQCVAEGKNISDLNQVYLAEECGFDITWRSRWMMAFGLAMIGGGRLSQWLIKRLSASTFTSFANTMTMLAFGLFGRCTPLILRLAWWILSRLAEVWCSGSQSTGQCG